MSKKLNELETKIDGLRVRLAGFLNEQARAAVSHRLAELESELALWEKFNKGEAQ